MKETLKISTFWNKMTTNIDLNLLNKKLISSKLTRLITLSKKESNKIVSSKAQLQRDSGMNQSNF